MVELQIWPGRFDGKVVLVTGSAGALGNSIANRLAGEGATVISSDISRPQGRYATDFFVLDVTKESDWEAALNGILRKYGRLDCLVLCHGLLGPQKPVWEGHLDEWQNVLNVNLTGCFLGIRSSLPVLMKQTYGRILMISSIAGKEGNPQQSAYSAAKAGVIALAKSAAKECASSGVTINCIAPTMLNTRMTRQLSQSQYDEILSKVPMGRTATLDELAALSAWIISEESSFSTGQCFDLSGGRAVY